MPARAPLATLLGLLALAAAPAGARAAVPPAQITATHAAFLTGRPGVPAGAVCVIDSGNTPGPDGAGVTARIDLAGGDGRDSQPDGHGTLVAQIINAPSDRYGLTGVFPSARVVSVKADTGAPGEFTDTELAAAIRACAARPEVQVLNLSLASPAAAGGELKRAVAAVITGGRSVVAAAGNDPELLVGTPANLPGVISVAGAGPGGVRCAHSTRAPVSLLALGCGVTVSPLGWHGKVTTGTGTSFAAPQVSAALVALRAYQPGLDARAAEQLLVANARAVRGGRMLDLAATFTAAGLDTSPPSRAAAPPRPRLAVRRRGARVLIRALNRPAGARLVALRGGRVIARGGTRLTVRAEQGVRVAYERDGTRGRQVSVRLAR